MPEPLVWSGEIGPKITDEYGPWLLKYVLDVLQPTAIGMEFGVGEGTSLRVMEDGCLYAVHGFDSFNGLPEDWRAGYPEGSFAQERIPEFERTELTVGLFERLEIREKIAQVADYIREAWRYDRESSLIHIDCDLYSSTDTVLDAMGRLPRSTIVVFDEYHGYEGWENHEYKAWHEYAERWSLSWVSIGHGPQQYALRIL